MSSDDPEKTTVYFKIRKIEDDLKADYYKLIEEKQLDEPAIGKPKPPNMRSKEYLEEKAAQEGNKKRQEAMKKETDRFLREKE